MEIINIDKQNRDSLITAGYTISNGLFIKLTSNMDIIEKIDKNKDKLTKELYNLPETIYSYLDEPYAYGSKLLSDYNPLSSLLYDINPKILMEAINQVIDELINIGIIYWDIHTDNILVHNNQIKVIDLDGASFNRNNEKFRIGYQKENFITLALEVYLHTKDNRSNSISYFSYLMMSNLYKRYFSDETIKLLLEAYDSYYTAGTIIQYKKFDQFLSELNDEERILALKEEIKLA